MQKLIRNRKHTKEIAKNAKEIAETRKKSLKSKKKSQKAKEIAKSQNPKGITKRLRNRKTQKKSQNA